VRAVESPEFRNGSAESFIIMSVSLQNNENGYAEFQFLLTGDLSSLKRSGVSSKSVKRLPMKHILYPNKFEN